MSKTKVSVKGVTKVISSALANILIRKGLAIEIDINIEPKKVKTPKKK